MKKALLDTNTLLLFLVGSVAPERVGGRRLEAFDFGDYNRLLGHLAFCPEHVTVPNVLTEVSNLIGSGDQFLAGEVLVAFHSYCLKVNERYEPTSAVAVQPYFRAMGLADAVLLKVSDGDTTVFTVDHQLTGRLEREGIETINLMRYKTP